MRLKFLFGALLFVGTSTSFAQIHKHAKRTYESSTKEAKAGDEITLIFKANIDRGWHLYSSEFPCEEGPIKMEFSFIPDKSYSLIGKIEPINPIDKHEETFECDVKIFKDKAEFRQKIKVLGSPLKISGNYEYQVCTDLTAQCVTGEGDYSFNNIKVVRESSSHTTPTT